MELIQKIPAGPPDLVIRFKAEELQRILLHLRSRRSELKSSCPLSATTLSEDIIALERCHSDS